MLGAPEEADREHARLLQPRLGRVQKNLVGWIVFYIVFIGVTILTCGLGGLLMPNAMREIRDCYRDDRGPEIGALFRMDRITNDLINYLVYFGAMTLGGAAGGIGGTVAMVLLQFQMPLAAEDRYQPLDNAKLSLKHVSAHAGDHVVFVIISTGLGMLSAAFCLLPLPVVAPVIAMAHWLWYEDVREEIDGIAVDAGVKAIEG